MATVSFAKLAQSFNAASQFAAFSAGMPEGAAASAFGWISTEGHALEFLGSGFTCGADGVPTGGMVDEWRFDLGDDGSAAPDLLVTDLSFDLSALAPLLEGQLSSEAQNDLLWRTALAGDDTIAFGSPPPAAGDRSIRFFADGRNISEHGTLFGGNDVMSGAIGGSADPSASAQASGDVDIISSGAVFGGNDRIAVTGTGKGSAVYGDAVAVYGLLAGGDDILTVQAGGSIGAVYGDAGSLGEGGVATGGGDSITLAGGATAVGDVADVSGTLVGGRDLITGSRGNDALYGDAVSVAAAGSARGGGDTIRGLGGDDRICGDWESAAGQARGGDDRLYGGAGDDELFGDGGSDRLDGGANEDMLAGGAGKDAFVFAAKLGSKNVDAIADFRHADDTIWLDDDVFTALGEVSPGVVDGREEIALSAFWASDSGRAHDASDRVLYDKTDGHLYYDADGTGKGKAMQFADLDAHLNIKANDFLLIA